MATLTKEAADRKLKSVSFPDSHTETVTPPRTPTATAVSVRTLMSEIRSIHHALTELPDLRPGTEINSLLTRLVSLCVVPYSSEFTTYFFNIDGAIELCEQLRPLCATAEGELERYWAQTITRTSISSEASPQQTKTLLTTFPYTQNYMDLTRIECLTLEAFLPASSLAPSHRPTPQNVAFIGSGPLPLTSLCILDMYPAATVHNIDRDEAALRVSQALCGRLACGARMTFACEDVSQIQMADNADGGAGASTDGVGKDGLTRTSWEAFDVVFLAALVGLDTGAKVAILAALAAKLTSGTLIVARSAQGLRAVLYPVLDVSEHLAGLGLEMLVEVHPWTKVVNSVVVLRVI